MEKQGLNTKEAKRTLASIRTIKDITPITGADRIETAHVLGWTIVVPKGKYSVGDKIVYMEIDSFLPPYKEYEFVGHTKINPITKGITDDKGYRLQSKRLRKQLSQGLIVDFADLAFEPTGKTPAEAIEYLNTLPDGADVTEFLGITKYEQPEIVTDMGVTLGDFPSQYTTKTDEIRVQSEPDEYKDTLGKPFYASAKIDGTSTTVVKHTDEDGTVEIIYASRNKTLDESSVPAEIIKSLGIIDKLIAYDKAPNLVLQGELYGEGIQENRLGILGKRWAVFNIKKDGRLLGLKDMIIIAKDLGLELPPIEIVGSVDNADIVDIKNAVKDINTDRKLLDFTQTPANKAYPGQLLLGDIEDNNFMYSIDAAVEKANGRLYHTNGKQMEGLVFRPLNGSDADTPTSFKAINNKFLLKYDA